MPRRSNTAARATTPALRLLILHRQAPRLLRALAERGYACTHQQVADWAEFRLAAARGGFDALLADHAEVDPVSGLRSLRASGVRAPLILITRRLSQEEAIAAVRAGVHDCVRRDDLERLGEVLAGTLAEHAGSRDAPVSALFSEQRRVEEELRRALDEKAALYHAQISEAEIGAALAQVAQDLITSQDTPHILDRLCRATSAALGCEFTHTFLLEDDSYTPVAGHGDTPELWQALHLIRIPRQHLERHAIDRDSGVAVVEHIRGQPVSPWLPKHRVGAGLFVPLHRAGELVGYLTAGQRPERFAPKAPRIAHGIAQLASLALQNARLVEEFERADHSRADFVANLSHELRTPLNVIIGYGDLLLDDAFGAVVAEQRDAVRRIGEQARELIGLVSTTLDLSRIEAGRVPLDIEEIDLRDVLDEIECETQVTFGESKRVAFSWSIAADLRPLMTDAVMLKVVIKNLVNNAMKFTPAGAVTVRAERRDDGIEIAVADTGPGIPSDQQSIIFEPFQQINVGKGPQKGVGLGLHIVQRLLVILGGAIRVDSEAGRGATFRVWLPEEAPRPGAPRLP